MLHILKLFKKGKEIRMEYLKIKLLLKFAREKKIPKKFTSQ